MSTFDNRIDMTLNDDFSFIFLQRAARKSKKIPVDWTRVMLKYIIIPAVIVLIVGVSVSYYNQQVYRRVNDSHKMNDGQMLSSWYQYRQ